METGMLSLVGLSHGVNPGPVLCRYPCHQTLGLSVAACTSAFTFYTSELWRDFHLEQSADLFRKTFTEAPNLRICCSRQITGASKWSAPSQFQAILEGHRLLEGVLQVSQSLTRWARI